VQIVRRFRQEIAMKVSRIAGLFAAALCLSAATGKVLAQVVQDHAGHADAQAHEHGTAGALARNGEQRWETDEALRRGMTEIRVASAMLTPAWTARQLSAAQSQQLADAIKGSVATMIAQCQLAPEADANLHLILARMLAAAGTLASEPFSPQGLPAIEAALEDYGDFFNHPGWLDGAAEDEHAHAH
jgi:hypothetical protein